MTTATCVSKWKKNLESSIFTVEAKVAQLQQDLAAEEESLKKAVYKDKITQQSYPNIEKYDACRTNINRIKPELELSQQRLEKLKKRNALYVSSLIIGQIETLNDEINFKIKDFEGQISAASNTKKVIVEKIIPIKEKVDVAQQFDSNTEAKEELEVLEVELAETTRQLEKLQEEYRVFSIAKDLTNSACLVSQDTPGYRLHTLYQQLAAETESFEKEIEGKWAALDRKVKAAIETYISAITEMGNLQAAAKIRNMELQSINKTGISLLNKLVFPEPNPDLKRLQIIFNIAASIE